MKVNLTKNALKSGLRQSLDQGPDQSHPEDLHTHFTLIALVRSAHAQDPPCVPDPPDVHVLDPPGVHVLDLLDVM